MQGCPKATLCAGSGHLPFQVDNTLTFIPAADPGAKVRDVSARHVENLSRSYAYCVSDDQVTERRGARMGTWNAAEAHPNIA